MKLSFLPKLRLQVWILAGGRLLSQIGTGFILFYAPIFFVEEVGLSATLVGLALGSASISGVIGRFLGGQWADSQFWGRRKILLLSAAISALADVFLLIANDFPLLVLGNLLMGLGVGFYWPATEAAVTDLTKVEERNEAFAVTRLADSLGLSLGVILGGALITQSGNYRALFALDGLTFIGFFSLIYFFVPETYQFTGTIAKSSPGWLVAWRDRRLMIYVVVNILFTTYIAQVQTTLPVYFKSHIGEAGFSPGVISGLFTWHIVLAALLQLPIARWLNRYSRIFSLSISMILWGLGFFLLSLAGLFSQYALIWAIISLSVFALAMIIYTPAASAFVADIAPVSLRGVYQAINSQCWAVGYLIAPPLGGWALDLDIAEGFFLALSSSVILGIFVLRYLKFLLTKS